MSSPFDNEKEREHYARYGRVLYAIQVLEYEMVNTYAVLRFSHRGTASRRIRLGRPTSTTFSTRG
jgi:hypothetical protein